MPGDELRMAFVLASQTPSSRAEESGSRPLSVKHRSDEVRSAGAWRHRHLEREWFAHTDGHMLDIMMSRSARKHAEGGRREGEVTARNSIGTIMSLPRRTGQIAPQFGRSRTALPTGHWYSKRWSGVTYYARIAGEVRWLWPGIWPARGPSRTSARLGYCIFLGKRDRSHPAGACH